MGKASGGATGVTLHGKLVYFRVDKTPEVYSVPKMKHNLPSPLAVHKHKGLDVLLLDDSKLQTTAILHKKPWPENKTK